MLGVFIRRLETAFRISDTKSILSAQSGKGISSQIAKRNGLKPDKLSVTPHRHFSLTPVKNVHSASTTFVNNKNMISSEAAQFEIHPQVPEGCRLLWRGDRSTHLFHVANRYGTRNITTVVTLNSARPLSYNTVKEAFRILQKKSLNLRTCLRYHGDELWFCEFANAEVDFKVLDENVDPIEASAELVALGFESNDSPHWRVWLIPRSMDTPCVLPEVKANYPYQYDYIFHPNHVICDGISISMFIQLSLNILNEILDGHSVDENQIGEFTNDDGLGEIEAQIQDKLLRDPNYLDKISSQFPPPNKPMFLTQIFPQPERRKEPFSEQITRIIDTQVIYSIQKKSKKAGITFNSSLTALINTAIVDLLKESGQHQDVYQISTNHIVNGRRYLPKKNIPIFGSYNYPLSHSSQVGTDVKENFWEYAKSLHMDLNLRLKRGDVLEQNFFRKQAHSNLDPSTFFLNPPPVVHDYCISNVGDVTPIIPGTGKHVQITDMVPYSYIHNFIHSNMHQIVTYRGHSRYTLSFDNNYMDKNSANILADRVVNLFAEFGNES